MTAFWAACIQTRASDDVAENSLSPVLSGNFGNNPHQFWLYADDYTNYLHNPIHRRAGRLHFLQLCPVHGLPRYHQRLLVWVRDRESLLSPSD